MFEFLNPKKGTRIPELPSPAVRTPVETWTISKEFGFDYGHRVFTQKLNTDYSIRGDCVCKHLHGHRGQVFIYLEDNKLTDGFVTDFHHLNWVKKFLDDCVDHKFILSLEDPWFANIINAQPVFNPAGKITHLQATQPLNTKEGRKVHTMGVYVPGTNHFAGHAIDASDMSGPEKEFFEGFFLVSFVPTSENLSKWLFDCVDAKMSQIKVRTSRVDWWETPKSKSTYVRR